MYCCCCHFYVAGLVIIICLLIVIITIGIYCSRCFIFDAICSAIIVIERGRWRWRGVEGVVVWVGTGGGTVEWV